MFRPKVEAINNVIGCREGAVVVGLYISCLRWDWSQHAHPLSSESDLHWHPCHAAKKLYPADAINHSEGLIGDNQPKKKKKKESVFNH